MTARSASPGLGAEVIEIPPESFSHGGTRNLLMERSAATTSRSSPRMLCPRTKVAGAAAGRFELADDVGLAFGPYRPAQTPARWSRAS